MKNLLVAVLLLLSCVIYAQENNVNPINENQIELATTEIGPTGLLQFNFEAPKTVSYRVFSQNAQVLSKEIEVSQGDTMRKIDLSMLESGSYSMKFYIDEVEVKQLMFTKL